MFSSLQNIVCRSTCSESKRPGHQAQLGIILSNPAPQVGPAGGTLKGLFALRGRGSSLQEATINRQCEGGDPPEAGCATGSLRQLHFALTQVQACSNMDTHGQPEHQLEHPRPVEEGMKHLSLVDHSQLHGTTLTTVKPEAQEDQNMPGPVPTKPSVYLPAHLDVSATTSPQGIASRALTPSEASSAARPSLQSPEQEIKPETEESHIVNDALDAVARYWQTGQFQAARTVLQQALQQCISIQFRVVLYVALADTIVMGITCGAFQATAEQLREELLQAERLCRQAVEDARGMASKKYSVLLPLCSMAKIYAMLGDKGKAAQCQNAAIEALRQELRCLPQGGHRILLSLVELLGPMAHGLIEQILGHCQQQYDEFAKAAPYAWQLPGLRFQLMAQRLLARPLTRPQGQELLQASQVAVMHKQELEAKLVQLKAENNQQAMDCVELDILASVLLTLGLEPDDKYTPQNIEITLLTQMASMDVEYLHSIACHPPPSCAAVLAVAWMRLMRAAM